MPKETKLETVLRLTLQSLKVKDYSSETLLRYQKKFHALNSFAQGQGISEPTDELFQKYLSDNKNKYTGKYSVLKERERIRLINLIISYITDGEVDTSRRSGTSICDLIQTVSFKIELNSFVSYLKEEGLQPNTINTYKRILVYLFLYCEEKLYHSVTDMVSGDIRNFILYLYALGHFQPTTIQVGWQVLENTFPCTLIQNIS